MVKGRGQSYGQMTQILRVERLRSTQIEQRQSGSKKIWGVTHDGNAIERYIFLPVYMIVV